MYRVFNSLEEAGWKLCSHISIIFTNGKLHVLKIRLPNSKLYYYLQIYNERLFLKISNNVFIQYIEISWIICFDVAHFQCVSLEYFWSFFLWNSIAKNILEPPADLSKHVICPMTVVLTEVRSKKEVASKLFDKCLSFKKIFIFCPKKDHYIQMNENLRLLYTNLDGI